MMAHARQAASYPSVSLSFRAAESDRSTTVVTRSRRPSKPPFCRSNDHVANRRFISASRSATTWRNYAKN